MQAFFSKLWADKRFRVSCAAVIVICLAAHGFAYTNASFLHDRATYFAPVSFDTAYRAKWMAQFWDCLIYFSYLPWLSGVLVTLMFLASIYMMVDMLRIRQPWVIWLIAGICVTHSSVIFAHLYWPTEILAALPMAAASAWFWSRENYPLPVRMGVSGIFMALSLASYGSYASVGPFLVIIVLLFQLIDGEDWKKVFKRGLEYVGTFLLGLIIYYVVLRLFLHFQNMELTGYLGEDRLMNQFPGIVEILGFIKTACQSTLTYFSTDPVLVVIFFLAMILLFREIQQAGKRLAKPANVLLLLFLLGVMPLCAGLIYVLAFGFAHGLMIFGYAMPLVLTAVLLDRGSERSPMPKRFLNWAILTAAAILCLLAIAAVKKGNCSLQLLHLAVLVGLVAYFLAMWIWRIGTRGNRANTFALAIQKSAHVLTGPVICGVLMLIFCVTVYEGILTANLVYAKADQIDISTKSMTTRVMAQVESCEGFEGTETLVLYGSATSNPYLYFDDGISQQEVSFGLTNYGQIMADVAYTYAAVFPSVLKVNANSALPIAYVTPDYAPEEQELISAMPVYPAKDSVKKIGDTIVVKLSEE